MKLTFWISLVYCIWFILHMFLHTSYYFIISSVILSCHKLTINSNTQENEQTDCSVTERPRLQWTSSSIRCIGRLQSFPKKRRLTWWVDAPEQQQQSTAIWRTNPYTNSWKGVLRAVLLSNLLEVQGMISYSGLVPGAGAMGAWKYWRTLSTQRSGRIGSNSSSVTLVFCTRRHLKARKRSSCWFAPRAPLCDCCLDIKAAPRRWVSALTSWEQFDLLRMSALFSD